MADRTITILTLSFIFLFLGLTLPYINENLGGDASSISADVSDIDYSNTDVDDSDSAWDIFINIFSMFFWTFGTIPAWLDYCLIILRLGFWYLIFDTLWLG